MMHLSEKKWLLQLGKNDKSAFKNIYKTYYSQIYLYARSFVLNDEIAKELTQDSFLLLWEKRSSLKESTNLKAYLYIVTRNNCINYLKHATAKRNFDEYEQHRTNDLKLNYWALNDEVSEKIIINELLNKIQKAIEQLPPKCRNIFILSRHKNMKNKEIATTLNISIKTVENQMTEALKRIRKQIKEFL